MSPELKTAMAGALATVVAGFIGGWFIWVTKSIFKLTEQIELMKEQIRLVKTEIELIGEIKDLLNRMQSRMEHGKEA